MFQLTGEQAAALEIFWKTVEDETLRPNSRTVLNLLEQVQVKSIITLSLIIADNVARPWAALWQYYTYESLWLNN